MFKRFFCIIIFNFWIFQDAFAHEKNANYYLMAGFGFYPSIPVTLGYQINPDWALETSFNQYMFVDNQTGRQQSIRMGGSWTPFDESNIIWGLYTSLHQTNFNYSLDGVNTQSIEIVTTLGVKQTVDLKTQFDMTLHEKLNTYGAEAMAGYYWLFGKFKIQLALNMFIPLIQNSPKISLNTNNNSQEIKNNYPNLTSSSLETIDNQVVNVNSYIENLTDTTSEGLLKNYPLYIPTYQVLFQLGWVW